MNTTRIITTVAMAALAAGLLGCSWGDTQFEWPWSRQSTPVTRPAWASQDDWPDPAVKLTKDPAIAATQPAATPATTVREEPLKIGKTREIGTSVLPIKGKFITVQEILHAAKDRLSAIKNDELFERRVDAVINRAIARRINNELVFTEAETRLSKAQKEHVSTQVDETLRGMIADADGSKTKLEKLLAEDDITIKELLEEHRRNITVRLYQQIKFLPAVSINRQMLLGYYTTHKADFSVDKKVAMQLIAVLLSDGFLPEDVGNTPTPQELAKARAAAKERIDEADKLLKGGADFAEAAKQFSSINPETGGKLPLWPEGSLRQKEVEKTAFSLKQGQRSGIVETYLLKNNKGEIENYGGFYIVKAYEIQEGRITSFEDAQEKIETILRAKQLDVLSARFSDRLSRESVIPESPEFVRTAVIEAIKLYGNPTTTP